MGPSAQSTKPWLPAGSQASRAKTTTANATSGHVRYELSGGQVGHVELWFSKLGERSLSRVQARFPHRSWAGTPPVRLWVLHEGNLRTAVDEATGRGEQGPADLMAHGLSSQLQRGWLTPLQEGEARARGFSVPAGHTRVLDLPCHCYTRAGREARACFHRGVLLELRGKVRGLPMRMRAVSAQLDVALPEAAFERPAHVEIEELTLERLLASKGVTRPTIASARKLEPR